ncbi:endonuclease/exonuclease/phosphatase family protein, partial [Toxoplasma gondii ARI]
MTYNILHK